MDKVVQSLVAKVAGTPRLLRRYPPVSSGLLQPAGATTDKILDGLETIVLSLSDRTDRTAQPPAGQLAIEEMIKRAGGSVLSSGEKANAIVCDARGIKTPENLSLLHSAMQASVSKLSKNGRIVLIGNDDTYVKNGSRIQFAASAAAAGVKGFLKSMSKEMAGKGTTTNMLVVSPEAVLEKSLSGPLAFFLSKRSAFVSGQTLKLSENAKVNLSGGPGDAFSLKDKHVVLTGASRGIGAYTAKLFHAEGAKLLLLDHPSMAKSLESFAGQLNCPFVSVDVTDSNANTILKDQIEKSFQSGNGKVDVVIHNAGITRDKSFKNMTTDNFQNVIDVNLSSVMRMDDMLFSSCLQPGSRLVYLSSISGIAGTFGQTNYSCSKAGIMGYVAAMGASVGQHGVGVNAIAPGFIETEMTDKIPLLTRNIGRHMNALLQGGYPVDVAEAILFLSSQAAVGLNGNTLRVCGHHLIGA